MPSLLTPELSRTVQSLLFGLFVFSVVVTYKTKTDSVFQKYKAAITGLHTVRMSCITVSHHMSAAATLSW